MDKKIDPYLSVTQDETRESEESEEKLKAIRVSALAMILKSLKKITLFLGDLKLASQQETHQRFTDELLRELHDSFLQELRRSHPLEENGVSECLVIILEVLSRWKSDFEIYQVAKTTCNRCKTDTEFPPEPSNGIIILANSLRETKYAFNHFSFEDILKFIRINLKMPCNKEGCGKQSYVQHAIDKLPSVFTIALEWEKNETESEILDTISVLATEIDLSKIYRYDGDRTSAKYRLVSMVCLHRDQFNCVAYENNRWIRYFHSEDEVIGDWKSVVRTFTKQRIRPAILFFENVMKRGQLVAERNQVRTYRSFVLNRGNRLMSI